MEKYSTGNCKPKTRFRKYNLLIINILIFSNFQKKVDAPESSGGRKTTGNTPSPVSLPGEWNGRTEKAVLVIRRLFLSLVSVP